MKASRFNRIVTMDDKVLAFNSMSCALAEVEPDFLDILNNIGNIDYNNETQERKELIDQMKEGNYIISDVMDELQAVQVRHLRGKYSTDSFSLTIAPTIACNFACPYCYETPKPGFLTEDVQKAIIDSIEMMAEMKKDIYVTWYGGEPLLAKKMIFDLSQKIIGITERNGVEYGAYMVTNGYLIDDETVKSLKDARVRGLQITIDGPPHIHNMRRILKNSQEPTFEIITGNISRLLKEDFDVTVRINIDKTNIAYLDELFDLFDSMENMKKVQISLGQVTAYTEACMSVSETCLDTEEYAKEVVRYQEQLHERGYSVVGYPYYPGVKANYCCADSSNSYVLDPEGNLYKCWNDIGHVEKSVGNILNFKENSQTEEQMMQNARYLLWSPFNHGKCVECDILPICMGGCPYNGILLQNDPECEKWKFNLDETLRLTYQQG